MTARPEHCQLAPEACVAELLAPFGKACEPCDRIAAERGQPITRDDEGEGEQ